MEPQTLSQTPIEKACAKLEGAANLARALGIKPPSISEWISRGFPPVERCPAIELATGVLCEDLRPDITWQRDKKGRVTGYVVAVEQAAA